MNIDQKLSALDQIYTLYNEVTATLPVACRKYCADCCTRNVTLTTLEGFQLISHCDQSSLGHLASIKKNLKLPRFQPQITTNQLAQICASGQDPPEEQHDHSGMPCPLLENRQCHIYRVRPFGCRCMLSSQQCKDIGYANMGDFTLTVNHVFLQTIEHLDRPGFTGNLSDVLAAFSSSPFRQAYASGNPTDQPVNLIPNQPLKILFVPPAHRDRLQPILNKLHRIRV